VLKEQLGVDADLVVGQAGVFEVSVDGKVVVSRTRLGFPSDEDVVGGVRDALRK
jgi:predicted Rdx family selenoprotein